VMEIGNQEVSARIEPDVMLQPDSRHRFIVDLSKLVCFDPQTEQLIA
jgi:multiple sugar transport system ATP-binding protein